MSEFTLKISAHPRNHESGRRFFSSVSNGVFNLISSHIELKEFGRLHQVIQSNKMCNAHWEGNLCQYAHYTEPLFNTFRSKEALRWVLFVRNIDARGWELHLRYPSSADTKPIYMPHTRSLFQVCKDGDVGIMKAMVERTQVDLEARDEDDSTPLHWAVIKGHLPVVQYVCGQGADKEVMDEDGYTPLHWAAAEGHLPVVQYLCGQGADKEARDEDDNTPLHLAARSGHLPVVQYLCEQGADKEARGERGGTPLFLAARSGHVPVMQYLCDQGADKEAQIR